MEELKESIRNYYEKRNQQVSEAKIKELMVGILEVRKWNLENDLETTSDTDDETE